MENGDKVRPLQRLRRNRPVHPRDECHVPQVQGCRAAVPHAPRAAGRASLGAAAEATAGFNRCPIGTGEAAEDSKRRTEEEAEKISQILPDELAAATAEVAENNNGSITEAET